MFLRACESPVGIHVDSVRPPRHAENRSFLLCRRFRGGPCVQGQLRGRQVRMTQSQQATALRVRRASEIGSGDPARAEAGVDRYLVERSDSGGLVAVMEHVLVPRALAAPVHRHSREIAGDGQLRVLHAVQTSPTPNGRPRPPSLGSCPFRSRLGCGATSHDRPNPPADLNHGRQSADRLGCRCSECRAARGLAQFGLSSRTSTLEGG